jgi:hypothetical protein
MSKCLSLGSPPPGLDLILVPGMGHDLPTAFHENVAEAIRRNADRGPARP